MKIVSDLCKNNKEEFEYIGITKLACCPCWTEIGIINPTRKESCVRGTHGSTYSNWLVPDNIPNQEELLQELKKLLPHKKVWENTGSLPGNLEKGCFELHSETQSSEDIIMGEQEESSSLSFMEIDEIQSFDTKDWTSLHPNFTPELVQAWQDHNFTYQQARDWINIHSPADQIQAIQEPEFCAWLRDIKQVDSDWVLNHGNYQTLRLEYQASQQTDQIQQNIYPPQNN